MIRAIAAVLVLACSITLSDAAPTPAAPMPCDSISAVLVAERGAVLGGPWVDAPEAARLAEVEHLIDHVAARC